MFTEQAFLDTVLEVRDAVEIPRSHVVVVDGGAGDGAITLEELERGGTATSTSRPPGARWSQTIS